MRIAAILTLLLSSFISTFAQDANHTAQAQVIVPRLVRFSGQIKDVSGTVGVTFTLHKSQNDSNALWVETQNVTLDASGKYTVLLGATKSEGLPMELFTSGEAQWLGIHVQGQAEMPRVLLVSVPYALKAAEAETLGGHSANDFVTSDKVTTLVKQQLQDNATLPAGHDATTKQTTTPAATAGPTKFSGNTTDNIVAATQSGTGTAITAVAPGTAVYGTSTNTSGNAYGVKGQTASSSGFGVYGLNTATAGSAVGIYGQSSSNAGVALSGLETSTTGTTKGIVAAVNSPNGTALVVQNTANGKLFSAQSGSSHTEVFSVDGAGDVSAEGRITTSVDLDGTSALYVGNSGNNGSAVSGGATSSTSYGIYGSNISGIAIYGVSLGSAGVYGKSQASSGTGVIGYGPTGVSGNSSLTGGGTGVVGSGIGGGSVGVSGSGDTGLSGSGTTYGVFGSGPMGVYGTSTSYGVYGNGGSYGVYGYGSVGVQGTGGTGMYGSGTSYGIHGNGPTAVFGESNGTGADTGVYGSSSTDGGQGVEATNGAGGDGILAIGGTGYAAFTEGNLFVNGALSKSSGSFKIDHPLDPANKYLYHSFVESPDMMNIYNGNITTDAHGDAVVHLPDWFEALNRDFRYQLTVMGRFAQAIVAKGVEHGEFHIKTDKPNVMVSWQVTGIRQDAWANAHRIEVEVTKPGVERGSYLHPELFGAPEEQGVAWKRHPGAMQRWKAQREAAAQKARSEAAAAPAPRAE